MRSIGSRFVLGALLLCGSACEHTPPPESRPTTETRVARQSLSSIDQLRNAATTLWSARIRSDHATLYAYQPASYRAQVDQASFMRDAAAGLFQFVDFKVGEIECRDDVGWVEIESRTAIDKYPDIPARAIHRRETWIREAGCWRPCTPEEAQALPQAPSLRAADAEPALRERFLAFGEARVRTDYAFMYSCIDPADREQLPFDTFAESEQTLRILAADPKWVEVIGDVGRVRAQYLVASADPSLSKLPPKTVQVTEHWRKEGSTWFRDVSM